MVVVNIVYRFQNLSLSWYFYKSVLLLFLCAGIGHANEENHKHAREILKSNENMDLHKISKLSKSRSQTSAQATEIIKKCKFCENSHHRGKCPAYGKVCHNCNKKYHFKRCCPCNWKILHEIKQTETKSRIRIFPWYDKSSKIPENLIIKNEPSDCNITLSSNGTPISYEIDTRAQCNVIPVKNLESISPKPDLQPVNVKFSAYNGSNIPVFGKCSLTLAR